LFVKHYIEAWKRYADFKGRSSRASYWWPLFATPIIVLVLGGISASVFGTASDETGPLESIYMLAWLCPLIAVGVRRLHDIGRSGWWVLIALTGIGSIVLIFWACRSGDTEVNAWGPPSDSTRSDEGKPQSRPPDYGARAPEGPIY
jgi:uncharacterized membrane protein YhaH (DUF805 family)